MKTRFCPSPTGRIHLGNARTALFNVLLARAKKGDFLLRIEDTDQARSSSEMSEALMNDLHWMHCEWQEGPGVEKENGPYWQSARNAVYEKYYAELLEKDLAYRCFATEEELAFMRKLQLAQGKPPRYDRRYANLKKEEIEKRVNSGESFCLRIRVPDDVVIEFVDLLHGSQRFLGKEIGDFIIRRRDDSPTFFFCNAIDDSLMGVTHALRGEDHLTNTPRQIFILRTLNLREPTYGHFSLVVGDEGGKLSKREGGTSIHDLRDLGYLPEAIANYLARLSHRYAREEYLTWDELAAGFSLDHFSKAPARFDIAQLNHWQKEAVKRLSFENCALWLNALQSEVPEKHWNDFCALIQANFIFPSEAAEWVKILFGETLVFNDEAKAILSATPPEYFQEALLAFEKHGADAKAIIAHLKETLTIQGKALFQPLRVALTAQLHGPELASILLLMPAQITKKRLL